jgi:hypothetical protein
MWQHNPSDASERKRRSSDATQERVATSVRPRPGIKKFDLKEGGPSRTALDSARSTAAASLQFQALAA